MKVILTAVSRFWTRHLVLCNVVSAGVLCGLGDSIQQKLEKQSKYDWARTCRMATIGLVFGLPTHYWYFMLDRTIVGNSATAVAKKVALDEIVMAPISIAVFFLGMGLMEGKIWRECTKELRMKFWPTYKVDLVLWSTGQAINFAFIPPTWRVLYVNGLVLCYDIFLSYMKHKDLP